MTAPILPRRAPGSPARRWDSRHSLPRRSSESTLLNRARQRAAVYMNCEITQLARGQGHNRSNGGTIGCEIGNGCSGNVKKVPMPSVGFGEFGNVTVAGWPSAVAVIDPVPPLNAVLTLNKVTTYSCTPLAFSVTPAVASRALVPNIVRLNLATPLHESIRPSMPTGSPRLAWVANWFASGVTGMKKDRPTFVLLGDRKSVVYGKRV